MRRALSRQEPDRVPIDFGQDHHNGIHEVAYANLLPYLGLEPSQPVRIWDYMQRLAVADSRVLDRFRVDTRYIFARPNARFDFRPEPDGSFLDEWGVYRRRCHYFCENVRAPLAGLTPAEIARYPLPDPAEPSRFAGLAESTRSLFEATDYALMAGSAASLYYVSAELMGFEPFMQALAAEPATVELVVDRVLEWMCEFTARYLDAIGPSIEGWWMGDDWGMQTGPIMRPDTFRRLFKPRYGRLLDVVRARTRAKVCLHSCGATYWVMGDLVDLGIDAVHPVQPAAAGNGDPERIKRDFGDKLAFYSNIANTTVLPHGTPEEVAAEAERKIAALAPGGGYVFSAGHNIQADVPPENIVALFDTAYRAGVYPIGRWASAASEASAC
jgi:uroporphyrinogen decarboxylase